MFTLTGINLSLHSLTPLAKMGSPVRLPPSDPLSQKPGCTAFLADRPCAGPSYALASLSDRKGARQCLAKNVTQSSIDLDAHAVILGTTTSKNHSECIIAGPAGCSGRSWSIPIPSFRLKKTLADDRFDRFKNAN